ncbi:MAG: ComEA family DNA-binding protein [Moorella sp. (in: Bacteria)]|nr:ComEA family DNA-binding protein [Moorella sp. (in: firmicutes)]
MERRQQLIVLAVLAVILFGGGYKYARWHAAHADRPRVESSGPAEAAKNQAAQEILVHVAGAVEKPGVYRLPRGSRVHDAVALAQALPEADLDALNLAAPLADGQKVTVPGRPKALSGANAGAGPSMGGQAPGAAAAAGRSSPFAPPSGSLININTAGKAELESLPGIGPSLAERIIEYREKNGPFLSPEDIKNVSGIGEKRYEQIKDKITT